MGWHPRKELFMCMMIDHYNRSDTYPKITVHGNKNNIQHEVSVSTIDEERLYCLQQRGISKGQAISLYVTGFINELSREFPLEYSLELKLLIDFEINTKRETSMIFLKYICSVA
jgi:Fe-S cluster assembly protein SufB